MEENESTTENYYWEKFRLKSFRKWPYDDSRPCSAKKMAEAGFYAVEGYEADVAKCYFCNKELDGWEPDDDPWVEHKKHSKNCVFLKFQAPEAELTVGEHMELIKMHALFLLETKCEEVMLKMTEAFESTLSTLNKKGKK